MRRLVKRVRHSAPAVAEALSIISTFDELVASETSLADLTTAAQSLSGATAHVVDLLNNRGQDSIEQLRVRQVLEADLPEYGAVDIALDLDDHVIAAAINVAGGSLGAVWLDQPNRAWTDLDYMVVERLAACAAVDTLRTARANTQLAPDRETALASLLTQRLNRESCELEARRAGLNPGQHYLVIALRSKGSAVGPRITAEKIRQWCLDHGQTVQTTSVSTTGAVIVVNPHSGDWTARIAEALRGLPGSSRIAYAKAESIEALSTGWRIAKLAAQIRGLHDEGHQVVDSSSLGATAALGTIPTEEIVELSDVQCIRALSEREPQDLEILQRYCEGESLRAIAAAMHLHHSTVDYRLQRVGRSLSIDLSDGRGRFRALLALTLFLLLENH